MHSSGPRKGPARPKARVGLLRAKSGGGGRKPKSGSGGPKRRRKIPWKGIGLTFLALILLGIGLAGLAYSMVPIPTPNDPAKAQASIVYYADGKTELERLSEVNRESVKIEKVPEKTRRAVIAAEDRDFYENAGVSISGLGRAVFGALRGADAGGGSTITQQYVKNYFLTHDQTLSRKGKEMIIAVKIDRELTKDQILENYLNTIYYGRNAYGIQTAAKAYFGKDIENLDVAESALLAVVINQPSGLDPALGPAATTRATNRWHYVLKGMVSKGWLTEQERSALQFPKVKPYVPKSAVAGPAGYLVSVVKNELAERGIKQSDLDRVGLRITTTIDPANQDKLVKAVQSNKPKSGRAAAVRVGAVAIKPKDGAILALYGGDDFAKQQFNDATQSHMQAGSTMKTFTVMAALKQGISTKTTFASDSPYTPPGTTDAIKNWDHKGHGDVDMPKMLAHSINTSFVRLNERVRPQSTIQAALDAGIPPKNGEGDASTPGLDANVANVLGSAAVRPIDLANAYATIAAGGERARPYIVKSVKDSADKVVYEAAPELKRAFNQDVAADTTDALRAVTMQGGTGVKASSVRRPVAGKTGTSNESMSAWFAGFTPEVSTAIGMFLPGGADGQIPQPMKGLPGLGSGELPVQVWTDFTRAYLEGKPVTEFPRRAGIGDDKVPPPRPTTTATPSTTTTRAPSPTTSTTSPTPTPGQPTSGSSRPSRPGWPSRPTSPPGGGLPEPLPPGAPIPGYPNEGGIRR